MIFDTNFPVVKVRINGYNNRKPWLTSALKQSIKYKNKLYLRSRRTSTESNVKHYKEYRNILNRLIRKTERNHYDLLLQKNKNNLRKSWLIIKEVINKKKQCDTSNKFLINNKVITDNKVITEAFNKLFVNVGPTLSQKLPRSNVNPVSYISDNIPNSIYLRGYT
jgi:hypothetical protein